MWPLCAPTAPPLGLCVRQRRCSSRARWVPLCVPVSLSRCLLCLCVSVALWLTLPPTDASLGPRVDLRLCSGRRVESKGAARGQRGARGKGRCLWRCLWQEQRRRHRKEEARRQEEAPRLERAQQGGQGAETRGHCWQGILCCWWRRRELSASVPGCLDA